MRKILTMPAVLMGAVALAACQDAGPTAPLIESRPLFAVHPDVPIGVPTCNGVPATIWVGMDPALLPKGASIFVPEHDEDEHGAAPLFDTEDEGCGGCGEEEEDLTRIVGTNGPDVIVGSSRPDLIDGGNGDDVICSLQAADWVYAGNGADIVFGGAGRDRIWGGNGDDLLDGERGRDSLYGERGDDQLFGGTGPDQLDGGPGENLLDPGSEECEEGGGEHDGDHEIEACDETG